MTGPQPEQEDDRRLTGATFERLITARNAEYFRYGQAHVVKCGVNAVRTKREWLVIPSYPDFEGVTSGGRQFVFDAKVCSQSSFALDKYRNETRGARARQLRHMLHRSRFAVPAFFLLHWNPRQLTTRRLPAATYAFPVSGQLEFWQQFAAGAVRSLSRQDCTELAVPVAWTCAGRSGTPRPDYLTAIQPWLIQPA